MRERREINNGAKMKLEIPNFKNIDIKNIVFDYNGTLAKDGYLDLKTQEKLFEICELYNVFVVTADTFGTVKNQLKDFDLKVFVLSSEDHLNEKAQFVKKIGSNETVSFGNGNNDEEMLKNTAISISVIGEEGCSKKALLACDIVCKDILTAMDLLLNKKRLIATLRQ